MSEGSGEYGDRIVHLPGSAPMGFLATALLLSTAFMFIGVLVFILAALVYIVYRAVGVIPAILVVITLAMVGYYDSVQALLNFSLYLLVFLIACLPLYFICLFERMTKKK